MEIFHFSVLVNLIDTPGHVDFTMEVERCLRVLDGGIVVLDASAGVEAQTVTVWRQALKYSVPRIAFLNKMDKPNADFEASLESIRTKLGAEPLLIQRPLGSGKNLSGIIDIVGLKLLVWNRDSSQYGRSFKVIPITEATENAVKIMEERGVLIDVLCDYDDDLASAVIEAGNYNNVTEEAVYRALRKLTLDAGGHQHLVTLCGSAYKNIGVQPLLDSAIRLLPSPDDVPKHFLSHYVSSDLVALAFKTTHHPQKGFLTFVRIYSGKISEGQTVHNLGKGTNEKVGKLMVAFADDFRAVKEIGAGGIAVISGLKETVTGDTIVKSKTSGNEAMRCSEKSPPSRFTALHLLLSIADIVHSGGRKQKLLISVPGKRHPRPMPPALCCLECLFQTQSSIAQLNRRHCVFRSNWIWRFRPSLGRTLASGCGLTRTLGRRSLLGWESCTSTLFKTGY